MTADDVVAGVGKLAKLYRNDIGSDTLVFYAEILLGKLTPDEACEAIHRWAARETRWPSPAHLIELVKPKQEPRDEAADLSQALLTLIARKGYVWESTCRYDGYSSAEEGVECELGEVAADVVRRCGGWASFCKEWGGEVGSGTTRAQLRGLCESAAKREVSIISRDRIEPGPQLVGYLLGGPQKQKE